jgi:hypothetical protein
VSWPRDAVDSQIDRRVTFSSIGNSFPASRPRGDRIRPGVRIANPSAASDVIAGVARSVTSRCVVGLATCGL